MSSALSTVALAKEDCATTGEAEISCNLNEFQDEVVVPCETDKCGHPFVRCRVNGVDCTLLVDTGTSHVFLDFVERRHPGTVMRANAAMRAHAFDDATFWKETTGRTAEELEKLWHAE
jgi:predicted aspartyl protease